MELMYKKLTSLVVLFFISIACLFGQEFNVDRLIEQNIIEERANEFREQILASPFTFNNYEEQCMYVLSFFPELENSNIVFREKKIKTTMAARPRWDFLFRSKKNRVYEVVFNPDTAASAVHFSKLPLNAQVGILAHEFCHIVDYLDRGNLEMALFGFRYVFSDKFKAGVEHHVDKLAIDKGLGWQLHDFSAFVLHHKETPKKYKQYKKRFYLSPEAIVQSIKEEYTDTM